MKTNTFISAALILLLNSSGFCIEYQLREQLSFNTINSKPQSGWNHTFGLQYLPELSLKTQLRENCHFDSELSFNSYLDINSDEIPAAQLKIYRFKMRLTTPQSEIRLGLQKINFGPALLLRSLRWFDRLDPSDPLALTDGVWALRYRYYFLNNTNIWFWTVYSRGKLKGYEVLPSVSDLPEFGGRLQFPLFAGETAVTLHTRKVEGDKYNFDEFQENRLGIEGFWDIGIGLWFENVWQHSDSNLLPYTWTKMMTLGMDYTFSLGNGLHLIMEHMGSMSSENPWNKDQDAYISALSLDYPLNITDRIAAFEYYTWETAEFYHYISWQRTLDNWIFNLSLFLYPESNPDSAESLTLLHKAGFGSQIMIIYNH